MGSIVDKLMKKQLINPPAHMKSNVHYEVLMGSVAYGCSNDTSDMDIYGFSIPYKDMIFPHLTGYIYGFGKQPIRFEQFQIHHIMDKEEGKEYDLNIHSIIKYFQLCMQNNPNMIDSLFVPRRCILHSTQIGEHVRENRKLFLHKGAWHRFKGYAYSQLNKMQSKKILPFIKECEKHKIDPLTFNAKEVDDKYPLSEVNYVIKLFLELTNGGKQKLTKRLPDIIKHGYDVKFAYHVVRLLNEVEQIMTEHDLDLERNREQLKSIRRGDWNKETIVQYFEDKEKSLEDLYTKCDLQHSPDENKIKKLLLECLEMHFGNLSKVISIDGSIETYITQLENIIEHMKLQLERKTIIRVEK